MKVPFEPKRPIQGPHEDDEDFAERLDEYHKRVEDYDIACDMAVDEQREREAFGDE